MWTLPAFFIQPHKSKSTIATLFFLIAFFFTSSVTHATRFASNRVFKSGGTARYSIAVDVNGDGNPDIVASSDAAQQDGGQRGVLTVLLGKGDGAFLAPKWIADIPDGAPQLAVGDFNRDGRPDLAIAANAYVKVYLGRGDGSFRSPLFFSVNTVAGAQVEAAYVGGGSNLDIVVTTTSGVSVLPGNGNGTFQKPIATMASGEFFAVGDRNGDGHLDLVVSSNNWNADGVNQIWFGDGTGAFKRGTDILIYSMNESSVLLADLDGDRKAELIVGEGYGTPHGLAIAWGDGYCCTRVQAGNASYWKTWIVAKDLNGDGKPDLAVSNGGSNTVSILRNIGNKSFASALNYSARSEPGMLTSADFNRDGMPDLALATADGIEPFINQGGARFPQPTAIETAYLPNASGAFVADAKVADLNADGHMDLAVQLGGFPSDINSNGPLYVLFGKGNGQFSSYPVVDFYENEFYMAGGIAIADYNHDSRPDVALLYDTCCSSVDGTLLLDTNLGGGHFSTRDATLPGTPLGLRIEAGYFNAGPNGDLVAYSMDSDFVAVFLGNGDGSFRGPSSYPVGAPPNSLLVRDVNKDGKQDVVTINQSNNISILLGKGDGTFLPARNIEVMPHPTSAAIGDFNRDGKLDFVVGGDTVQVLMAHGDGSFAPPVTLPVTGSNLFVGQADLRHINQQDILVANGKSLIVLYGNGDGTFLAPTAYSIGKGPGSFVIGDFNEDGAPDVVGMNGSTALTLLLNQGGTLVSLKSNTASVKVGQPVTFTATVSASVPGAGEVTGTVAFKDGAKGIGFVHLSNGKAIFMTSQLTAGTHTMTASYWGNGFFNPQISSPITVRTAP